MMPNILTALFRAEIAESNGEYPKAMYYYAKAKRLCSIEYTKVWCERKINAMNNSLKGFEHG